MIWYESLLWRHSCLTLTWPCFGRKSAHKLRLTGIKTELKHIEKELASLNPDYKKVQFFSVVVRVGNLSSCFTSLEHRLTKFRNKFQSYNMWSTLRMTKYSPVSVARSKSRTFGSMKNASSKPFKRVPKPALDLIPRSTD